MQRLRLCKLLFLTPIEPQLVMHVSAVQAQQAAQQARQAVQAGKAAQAEVTTLRQELAFKTQESAELAALCEELVSDIETRNQAVAAEAAAPA